MPPELPPPHKHLKFMSPLSEARATELIRFLANYAQGPVLDLGCGWGSLLLRLAQQAEALPGVGVDTDEEAIAHAQQSAAREGLSHRLEFVAADARDFSGKEYGAAVCIGASQIWSASLEMNQPLNYGGALDALRSVVPRGAPVVYGEGIWMTTPTDTAMAPLGGRPDELIMLPDLLDLATSRGFAIIRVHQATQDEWDEFESGYASAWAEWLATNPPDHPSYADVLARATGQRHAYFRGYRAVLGMAYLCLLAV